jgi:hypothetical protein
MGRIDDVKHDADVIERVLGFADHPPNYAEFHTDVVDVEVHPSLVGRSSPPEETPHRSSRSLLSMAKNHHR